MSTIIRASRRSASQRIRSSLQIVALVPSILSKDKPALQTSLMTAAVALSIAVVYVTLSIPFAAISAALNGALWLVLAVQQWRTKGK